MSRWPGLETGHGGIGTHGEDNVMEKNGESVHEQLCP
jgi:hypothetical protein